MSADSYPPQIPGPVKLATEDPPFPVFFGDERIMNPRIFVGAPLHELIADPQAARTESGCKTFGERDGDEAACHEEELFSF